MAVDNSFQNSMTDKTDESVGIEIRDLRKTFDNGNVVANDDLNLTINDGEFLVFLGPSGCGKTTALRCIAGLEKPDSGQIIIRGEDVTREPPRNRDLAFVFQSIALFPHKTVRENIRFGLDMEGKLSKNERNSHVEDVASLLGIETMLERKPDELSGGQQQRVSLGRAMVMEPAAFLLDEPLSALDANLRDKMQTEIKKLQQNLNTAMVFVTHDQEEAMSLGDRIVIMENGRIQQIGSPYDIYNDPNNKFVSDFIGSPSTNSFESTIQERNGKTKIKNDIFEIDVTQVMGKASKSPQNTEVVVGIRPEYLTITDRKPLFEANIQVVEPHGDYDVVLLESNGEEMIATTDQGEVSRDQSTVGITIDPNDIWLFDSKNKRVI